MVFRNLHMHSTFDDGKDTCHDMLEACLKVGMPAAGISLHSPMPFENDWAPENTEPFLAEMALQKEIFSGRMTVFTGIELDTRSMAGVDLSPFDYVIGAVHHLPGVEPPLSVDHAPEITMRIFREFFSGDPDAMAEGYFGELLKVAECREAAICAHFDLLTKFDEKYHFMNPESPRYQKAALRALNALLDAEKIIEVNTGAISRGWRSTPYPSKEFLLEIRRRGGKVTVSSDSHAKETVDCAFGQAVEILASCGFAETWQIFPNSNGGKPFFAPVPLEVSR
ncbi:MAG: PHP domain-containing protein [Clostridiales bacterium]|nr:PHP domain-containing protein [Clostridiales bacterium]